MTTIAKGVSSFDHNDLEGVPNPVDFLRVLQSEDSRAVLVAQLEPRKCF
jgi:hypothetical protein